MLLLFVEKKGEKGGDAARFGADFATVYLMYRHATQPIRRTFLHMVWRSMYILGALALLSACGKSATLPGSTDRSPTSTSAQSTTATPAATPTFTPIAYPFHPSSAAAAALNACGDSCYSPEQIQTFYNLNPLYARGYFGQGMTIAIIDSFGSPTIKKDLHVFDQTFGLPDPPKFDILTPLEKDEPNDPNNLQWAHETTLDVEWAHAIAPGANILLLINPVDETEGIDGFPEIGKLLTYAMDHHLTQIVSLSLGTSEPNLQGDPCNEGLGNGQDFVRQFDQNIFQRAVSQKISIFVASGDDGVTNASCKGGDFSYPNAGWPAADPLITSVGGTAMDFKDDTGNYGGEGAWSQSGGGLSQFYSEPDWQKKLPQQSALKGKRGFPDVAADSTFVYVTYHTYDDGDQWTRGGGTSASTPLWAGLAAIFDQMAGGPIGLLNPAIYQLAGQGFHDITDGDNSQFGVQGFSAGPGWDMVTGWGSPDAAVLAPLLVSAAKQLGG